jgi:hypothetical protein
MQRGDKKITQLNQELIFDIAETVEEKPRDFSNPKSHGSNYK